MPQLDSFIFFDEVVRITFLFLFVYILLCIYFSPFFFKSRIFLAAFDNIQKLNLHLKILLQTKI
jgi:hypothetical protein